MDAMSLYLPVILLAYSARLDEPGAQYFGRYGHIDEC